MNTKSRFIKEVKRIAKANGYTYVAELPHNVRKYIMATTYRMSGLSGAKNMLSSQIWCLELWFER